MTDSAKGEFQEFNKVKVWVEKNSRCMTLYARWLDVTYGFPPYWVWNCYKEISEDNVEVVKLMSVCWVNVRGQFKMSELSAGVVYEIAYKVKLTNGAFGWELPVTVKIRFPDGREQKRQYSLFQKPRGEWIELSGGSFEVKGEENGEVWFDLCQHGGHWKKGLIIQGIIIKPAEKID
ncbi:protein PHLOEM PROTEIN 2-LIKE A1-like [Prunus avium]|uniref:Protein PHLOEM PROTEIN 2-LIKE A1-like n=1 Tax=Prunus avium TaxID=42229 RepID=A0A6P5RWB7_PRUAV|nr:protein PHLOEM PROTEIN 2-LIKE A1-like [Prunus avium]